MILLDKGIVDLPCSGKKPIMFGYGEFMVFSSTKLYDIFQQSQIIQEWA